MSPGPLVLAAWPAACAALLAACAALLAACAVRPPPPPPAPPVARVAIVVSEPGPVGARLVAIDEHGDRQFELVAPATTLVRDVNPAVSPDGAWLVFASSRERPLDETSLWIAPVGVAMPPRRLTVAPARDDTAPPLGGAADRGQAPVIDAHPAWLPDGSAIVFASTRARGNFDLWRLAIRGGEPGELAQLTDAPGHEVTPSVARDGAIVYAAVTPDEARRQIETHLEQRGLDGAITRLTAGPADSSPAVSPDGREIAFARPVVHDDKPDSELWLMPRTGDASARPLVELPLTEEAGPVWSRDGRFVFATSAWRGETGRVVFSSIIHVDVREAPPVARILEDRVGAIVRFTPAVTATPLDAAALRSDPDYVTELGRIMRRAVEQQAPPR